MENTLNKLKDILGEDYNTSKYSAFYNLFLIPASLLYESVLNKIENLERFQGLLAPAILSETQVDSIMAQYMIFRNNGTVGYAFLRGLFTTREQVIISPGDKFYTTYDNKTYTLIAEGAVFVPSDFEPYTEEGSFFISPKFKVFPAEADSSYQTLPAGTTFSGPKGVKFLLDSSPSNVVDKESNEVLYNRLLNSIGARTFSDENSIRTILSIYFPTITIYDVFGPTDSEVTRNKIEGGNFSSKVTLSFKGKILGSKKIIEHRAFETSVEDNIFLTSNDQPGYTLPSYINDKFNYVEQEISQEDYDGLYLPYDGKYCITGQKFLINSDNFATDSNWVYGDALTISGILQHSQEIIKHSNGFIFGVSETQKVFNYSKLIQLLGL